MATLEKLRSSPSSGKGPGLSPFIIDQHDPVNYFMPETKSRRPRPSKEDEIEARVNLRNLLGMDNGWANLSWTWYCARPHKHAVEGTIKTSS